MGWSIGWSDKHQRDVGYGVPCTCEHPDCNEQIDRGLAHVCGDMHDGGDHGCGLYFCESHLEYVERDGQGVRLCNACASATDEIAYWFDPKPDHLFWELWKLTNSSWRQWREENESQVTKMRLRRLTSDLKPVEDFINEFLPD